MRSLPHSRVSPARSGERARATHASAVRAPTRAVTASTTGYSDSELTTPQSDVWCGCFILLSMVLFTAIVSQFSSLHTRRDMDLRRWKVASQTKTASLLTDELMFKLSRSSNNGRHDRLSFLVEMLVHTDLVQRVEVNLLLEYFELLDQDKSGELDISELEAERQRVIRAEEAAAAGAASL